MLSLGIITADMYTENSVDGNIGESYIVNPFNGGIWIATNLFSTSTFTITYGMVNNLWICN